MVTGKRPFFADLEQKEIWDKKLVTKMQVKNFQAPNGSKKVNKILTNMLISDIDERPSVEDLIEGNYFGDECRSCLDIEKIEKR